MINNSLFLDFLRRRGLDVYKGESTRDLICLSFEFGSRSYEDERKRIQKLYAECPDSEEYAEYKERLASAIDRIDANKDRYKPITREQLREKFYSEGCDVVYKKRDKQGNITAVETIHYKMLYRTSAKAKLGQVIFINEKLFDTASDWLTMGLDSRLPAHGAKIVELSAYKSLTTSAIVDRIHIPVNDILILKDQDSFFRTAACVVRAESDADGKRRCTVSHEEYDVKNTLWDGMALIETGILPESVNGMVLMRNHFFKACAFRTRLQKFFVTWCYDHGYDYDTYTIKDMFGYDHKLKDIKIITTDNAIKWKKFIRLMGASDREAYTYWSNKIRADGDIWGIVKTDHQSKLGEYQQLSYQMINSLPCTENEIQELTRTTLQYVDTLKTDDAEFARFLRKNASDVNNYEMLADMYSRNHDFANSKFFRHERKAIISAYMYNLRNGHIMAPGDNLTICGNPYSLLLYTVGEDWKNDPTLKKEDGTIQCFTTRFRNGEYLCGFRSPQNAPNNVVYLHNVQTMEMFEYFDFSDSILAVNGIETDIQARCNGADFDSDFLLVSNDPILVNAAKRCYEEYPTVVNDLKESGITYDNAPADYAAMDNKFSRSRLGIGYSSNLAQLAMTYYWTEMQQADPDTAKMKELYDNFVILSVVAQVIIDGCKRVYEVDGMDVIQQTSKMPCMSLKKQITLPGGKVKSYKCDYPLFMRYTRPIQVTKNGKELDKGVITTAKQKLSSRINSELVCPMNYLEGILDKVQGVSLAGAVPTEEYFIKLKGDANRRQVTKIRTIVADYQSYIISLKNKNVDEDTYMSLVCDKSREVYEAVSKMRIANPVTINRLIETALGMNINSAPRQQSNTQYRRKILNILYKSNPSAFLANFRAG